MSQSRQGAARSAAILLYSYHLNTLRDHKSSQTLSYQQQYHSNELMARYIEQQLEDQKKLLYLDIPTLRNHNSLMRKLRLNPRSEIDLTQLDRQPMHRRLHQRYFGQSSSHNGEADVGDERSGVDDLYVNKSAENSDFNGSSGSHTHNVSFITDGGYTNPLAYSTGDLDDSLEDDDEDYHRNVVIDNQEISIGTMPTPASEGPSIAVCKKKLLIDVYENYFLSSYFSPKKKYGKKDSKLLTSSCSVYKIAGYLRLRTVGTKSDEGKELERIF